MRHAMAPCPSIGGLLAVLSLVALSNAGPLGPLPNVTSSDVGLKEGSCVLGDVVYMSGDTFAGATPCERCACAAGSVQCAQERCEPRPGCKALHRPDHCCPTYQCECEQEGRVYGNGEKLVDPEDPCRVCYCQGGEVVCRRIACFVRDDCQPRLVPGRCCPEYDNCPLRGVTAIPGLAPPVSSISTTEYIASSPAPPPPKENIKQEITIKEITPVSEIPIITDVKIKEIVPSPSIEVPEYPSSKSPLIPREAIPDRTVTNSAEISPKTEESVIVELISPLPTDPSLKPAEKIREKSTADMLPSKISLSTQDSINSEIYPSHIPTIMATMGVPPLTSDSTPVGSTATRVAMIEEEDIFDHNPAFPPIPDDLSVVGTHEDEILSDPTADNDHITNVHGEQNVPSALPPAASTTKVPVTSLKPLEETTSTTTTTAATSTTTARTVEGIEISTPDVLTSTTIQTTNKALKSSPMLNIRAAIPTRILDEPSSVTEDITGELDDVEESVTAFEEPLSIVTSTTTESVIKIEDETTATNASPQTESRDKILPSSSEVTGNVFDTATQTTQSATYMTRELGTKLIDEITIAPQIGVINKNLPRSTEITNTPTPFDTTSQTTQKITDTQEIITTKNLEDLNTIAFTKTNIPTEITSQTEFSSLPIETSDQNPHDSFENVPKEKTPFTTKVPLIIEITTAKATTEPEEITATRASPTSASTPENQSYEHVETTEFVLTSFGPSESTTGTVELIKISPTQKIMNAAIIDSAKGKKNNVLTDLIKLVDDVASISNHTDAPDATMRTTTSNSFSDSEELMPVNAGYKSKNSNFNLNSITEIPLKSKNQLPVNKQKVVEIQDEDTASIADALPPHDKVEPTTRRPIIDNVSDTVLKNETEKKDIEIIAQSYVPTINRRPTKVVMKKSNDKPVSGGSTEEQPLATYFSDGTSSPDDVTGPPGAVTGSGSSSGELGTTADPTLGSDSTTATQ